MTIIRVLRSRIILALASIAFVGVYANPVNAQVGFYPNPDRAQTKPDIGLMDNNFINDIRSFVDTEVVRLSVKDQNKRYESIDQEEVIRLDKQWRAERKSDQKPLISATLSNPLSSYLTRVQAGAKGLYTEIFVMDNKGLNVGQSNITSDYWQGDEAKFQKTFPRGPKAVFIDEAEFDDDLGVWKAQINMSIADKEGAAIGAITLEVNLTELQRRKNYNQTR